VGDIQITHVIKKGGASILDPVLVSSKSGFAMGLSKMTVAKTHLVESFSTNQLLVGRPTPSQYQLIFCQGGRNLPFQCHECLLAEPGVYGHLLAVIVNSLILKHKIFALPVSSESIQKDKKQNGHFFVILVF
jgi:hypothetical protein